MTVNHYQLPVIDTIKQAWEKVNGAKASYWAAFGIMILVGFAIGILHGITDALGMKNLGILWQVISSAFSFIAGWGLIYMGIQRAITGTIRWGMMWQAFKISTILRMIGLYIAQAIVILPVIIVIFLVAAFTGGAMHAGQQDIALPVMGVMAIGFVIMVYLLLRMYLAKGIVLTTDNGPINAINMSFRATKSNVWRLVGLTALIGCILVLSVLTLGILLIWTMPLCVIIYGLIYEKLMFSKREA